MITRMTKCRMAWGVLKDGRKKWGSFICQKPRSWHQWSTPSWIHFCPSLNECEILDGPMDPMKSHGPQKSPMGSGEEFCKSRFYVDLRGNLRRWSFHCWWFRNPARKPPGMVLKPLSLNCCNLKPEFKLPNRLRSRWLEINLRCMGSFLLKWLHTPRKINMEPENTPLEKENHLPNHHFQVLYMFYVNLRGVYVKLPGHAIGSPLPTRIHPTAIGMGNSNVPRLQRQRFVPSSTSPGAPRYATSQSEVVKKTMGGRRW